MLSEHDQSPNLSNEYIKNGHKNIQLENNILTQVCLFVVVVVVVLFCFYVGGRG